MVFNSIKTNHFRFGLLIHLVCSDPYYPRSIRVLRLLYHHRGHGLVLILILMILGHVAQRLLFLLLAADRVPIKNAPGAVPGDGIRYWNWYSARKAEVDF